ncbi:hypothetical protein BH23CHL4_BH23CHL4_25300 [soil metagenome]
MGRTLTNNQCDLLVIGGGTAGLVAAKTAAGFNARFAVPADDLRPAWRPLDPAMDPWQICCFGYLRTVAHDDTIRLGEHHLQLGPRFNRLTWAKTTVEVREHLDGSLSVWHADQQIAVTPAPQRSPRTRCSPIDAIC